MEDKLLEILDENILNEINVRINSMEVKISGSEGKTLCDPMECSPPGSPVHGILQARTLEWAPTPGDLPDSGIKPVSLASATVASRSFYHWHHLGSPLK